MSAPVVSVVTPAFNASATIADTRPPAAVISAAASWSRSARRAQITSAAPSRASRNAVARPMPADAPVIATTRLVAISKRG